LHGTLARVARDAGRDQVVEFISTVRVKVVDVPGAGAVVTGSGSLAARQRGVAVEAITVGFVEYFL
jgi:GTP-binding protein EngB required for normal cell division